MTNIVATGISSKLTSSEKAAIRTNIDIDKGVRDYAAYVDSIFAKATLDLNFAKNSHRVYEALGLEPKQLTTAITTVRSTTATYDGPVTVGSAAANTPRITYDPTTGVPLGLLIEEGRTNLALQSQDFTTTWLQSPDASVNVTSNTTVAPDKTSTADKFVEGDTANTFHDLYQTIAYTAGVRYCFSVYLKASERSKVTVFYGATGAFTTERRISVDLIAKTFIIGGTGATGGMVELPNGWFRVWITGVADVTGVTPTIIRLLDNTGTVIYPGVINSGIFVWGAQVEAGSFPTSYIPTTTATVTRSADQLSALLPATTEGTIYVVGAGPDAVSGKDFSLFTLSDGTQNNRVLIRRNASTSGTQFAVVSSGTAVANMFSTQKASGQSNKYAISWKLNQFLGAQDGAIVLNDTGGNTPVNLTQLGIGSAGTSGSFGESLNGAVERIVFIPRALTAAELQTITA